MWRSVGLFALQPAQEIYTRRPPERRPLGISQELVNVAVPMTINSAREIKRQWQSDVWRKGGEGEGTPQSDRRHRRLP